MGKEVFFEKEELKEFLLSLGFDGDVVNKVADEVRTPTDVRVVSPDDRIKLLPPNHCVASLVSVDQGYRVLVGKVEVVDEEVVDVACGPYTDYVTVCIVRLEPGTIIYQYIHGFTGDIRHNYNELIVCPPLSGDEKWNIRSSERK